MLGIYSMIIGVVIVACALFLLRREFMRAYFIGSPIKNKQGSTSSSDEVVLLALNDMEEAMKEMSEAFYDITGDLEGNYSVHDKELQLLTERIEVLEELLKTKDQAIVAQNKEIKKLEKMMVKENSRKVLVEEAEDKPVVKLENTERNTVEQVVETIEMPQEHDDDIKAKIISMRSQGYSLRQIAKSLDIGLGEIQLILNMKRS